METHTSNADTRLLNVIHVATLHVIYRVRFGNLGLVLYLSVMEANYDILQTGDAVFTFTFIVIGGVAICWFLLKLFPVSPKVPASPTQKVQVGVRADAMAVNAYHAATKLYKALLRADKRVLNFTFQSADGVTREVVSLHPSNCIGWNIVSLDSSVLNEQPFTKLEDALASCPETAYILPIIENPNE
jgi:hypothetical protein